MVLEETGSTAAPAEHNNSSGPTTTMAPDTKRSVKIE